MEQELFDAFVMTIRSLPSRLIMAEMYVLNAGLKAIIKMRETVLFLQKENERLNAELEQLNSGNQSI